MAAVPPASGVQQPHPLKGIVNSNDDPNRCANCSVSLQETPGGGIVKFCCGKEVCISCLDLDIASKAQQECSHCRLPEPRLGKELTACLKKHMKKGRAWARVGLANGSKVSTSEMMALYHEAARQGHPVALYAVGRALLVGFGCPVDLTQAEIYLERCLALSKVHTYSNNIIKCCKEDLVQLASHHFEVKSYERAKSIALPLAEEGFHLAQLLLGSIFTFREGGNTSLALQWYSAAAFTSSSDWGGAEVSAMLFSMILERHAQAKFWGRLGKKGLVFISDTEVRSDHVEALVQVQRELRAIRDVCGGCGVEFEGRERKFCRGCRAYCYCSRECQKMHWNRKDGGHREDCKGMMELKQKMKEKMRVEAMKSSESK